MTCAASRRAGGRRHGRCGVTATATARCPASTAFRTSWMTELASSLLDADGGVLYTQDSSRLLVNA